MNEKNGFALVFAVIIMSIIMAIMVSFFAITTSDLSLANTTANTIRAYYLAESGLSKKFVDLRGGDTTSTYGTINLATGNSGSYSVSVSIIKGGPFPIYMLRSTGTYKNISKILQLTVRQISCARYIYLTNNEKHSSDDLIWFITNDRTTGPLHTNDQLNIANDPVFEGPVSSTASSINYYNGGPPEDNPEFRESLALNAPTIRLPTTVEIIDGIRSAAQQRDGLYLTGNTSVKLLSNKTMKVTNYNQWPWWINKIVSQPRNGALFVDNGYIAIYGTLDGQLTVGTNNNIYVTNNIFYKNLYLDYHTINPHCTDMLGLVSQNNVYVDYYAPYNLEIDAYIIALNESFIVDGYYDMGLKGTLTIYGGITQVVRGQVGTWYSSSGDRRSGYAKNYIYDARWENDAPAYFPPAKDNDERPVFLKTLWVEL